MGKKISYGNIQSLLHFDFPYWFSTTIYEPNYGLDDVIGKTTWQRLGGTNGSGYDLTNKKFGAASSSFINESTYISGTQFGDLYNLDPQGKYEIEWFSRITTNNDQMIFKLCRNADSKFQLKQNADGRLSLSSSVWEINIDGPDIYATNIFDHILIKINQGNISFYINGNIQGSATITTTTKLTIDQVCLGGYDGNMDEYCFRYEVRDGNPIVPIVQYSGNVNISELYGYGDGSLGDVTITTTDTVVNSYAPITSFSLGGSCLTIDSTKALLGTYGTFAVGDEVMIHCTTSLTTNYTYLFDYCIRKVVSVEGDTIILDKEIDTIPTTSDMFINYELQLVKIPCFKNLTINTGGTIVPEVRTDESKCGGILALKCSGTLTLLNNTYIYGTNLGSNDTRGLTNNKLILCNSKVLEKLCTTYQAPILIMANIISTILTSRIGGTIDGLLANGGAGYSTTYIGFGGSLSYLPSGNNGSYSNYTQSNVTIIGNNLSSLTLNTISTGTQNSGYAAGLCFIAGTTLPSTIYQPIRYSVNGLSIIESVQIKGSAIQKSEYAFDFTNKTVVDSFYLMGYQPNNSVRKMIFNIDNVWYRFKTDGSQTLEAVATQTPTTDSILSEGNTIPEISILKNITAFVGKKVQVGIAMSLSDDSAPSPTLRVGVLAR